MPDHLVHRQPGEKERMTVRRTQALEMRCGGASYRQIAQHLNVSRQTAYTDVQAELAVLDAVKKRRVERLRELELERCDRLIVGLWPHATPQIARDPRTGDAMADASGRPIYTTPDIQAVGAILRAMERRAKMLGLDVPVDEAPPSDIALRIIIDGADGVTAKVDGVQ